jgi:hypothetical protein
MARIKVPGKHDEIVVFDGDKRTAYKHEGGEIDVADAHVQSVLATLSGSEISSESPTKKEK